MKNDLSNDDYSLGLVGLKGHAHNASFDPNETQPVRVQIRSPKVKILSESQPKFNWVAFMVMLIAISIALAVGFFIPGILDEYIAIFIINIIYAIVQIHGFKTPKK